MANRKHKNQASDEFSHRADRELMFEFHSRGRNPDLWSALLGRQSPEEFWHQKKQTEMMMNISFSENQGGEKTRKHFK